MLRTDPVIAMGFKDWIARITGQARPAAPAPVMPVTPAAPTEADILAALDRVQTMIAGGVVPAAVASRVARVSTTVRDTMPRLRNLGLGSPEAYSVMATATDYLPEAIGGYTRLPRRWADSRPIENGKTSLMLLIDQLDLLGATMDKIFDAVVRVDADALIAHGRFLQEKFGHASTGGSLDLGQQSSAPAAPQHPGPAVTTGDDDGRSLTETVRAHAEAVRAQLARITALREASPDIATPPSGLNPLDLGALDPLTPGRFPGIGPGSPPPESAEADPAVDRRSPELIEGHSGT